MFRALERLPLDIKRVAVEVNDVSAQFRIVFDEAIAVRAPSASADGIRLEGIFGIDADANSETGVKPSPSDAFRSLIGLPEHGLGTEIAIDIGNEALTPGELSLLVGGQPSARVPVAFTANQVTFSMPISILDDNGFGDAFRFALLVGDSDGLTDAGPDTFGEVVVVPEPDGNALGILIIFCLVVVAAAFRATAAGRLDRNTS